MEVGDRGGGEERHCTTSFLTVITSSLHGGVDDQHDGVAMRRYGPETRDRETPLPHCFRRHDKLMELLGITEQVRITMPAGCTYFGWIYFADRLQTLLRGAGAAGRATPRHLKPSSEKARPAGRPGTGAPGRLGRPRWWLTCSRMVAEYFRHGEWHLVHQVRHQELHQRQTAGRSVRSSPAGTRSAVSVFALLPRGLAWDGVPAAPGSCRQ